MERSRIPEFYKLSVADRVRLMRERGWLSETDYQALVSGEHTLKVHHADKMIENVVGANGTIGVGKAVHSPPDGYTVSIGNWPSHITNGAIYNLQPPSLFASRLVLGFLHRSHAIFFMAPPTASRNGPLD